MEFVGLYKPFIFAEDFIGIRVTQRKIRMSIRYIAAIRKIEVNHGGISPWFTV
jgi:hypothetical protein